MNFESLECPIPIEDAAKELKISKSHLLGLVSEGHLPVVAYNKYLKKFLQIHFGAVKEAIGLGKDNVEALFLLPFEFEKALDLPEDFPDISMPGGKIEGIEDNEGFISNHTWIPTEQPTVSISNLSIDYQNLQRFLNNKKNENNSEAICAYNQLKNEQEERYSLEYFSNQFEIDLLKVYKNVAAGEIKSVAFSRRKQKYLQVSYLAIQRGMKDNLIPAQFIIDGPKGRIEFDESNKDCPLRLEDLYIEANEAKRFIKVKKGFIEPSLDANSVETDKNRPNKGIRPNKNSPNKSMNNAKPHYQKIKEEVILFAKELLTNPPESYQGKLRHNVDGKRPGKPNIDKLSQAVYEFRDKNDSLAKIGRGLSIKTIKKHIGEAVRESLLK